MMPLEQQVVSREPAEKLRDLGVPQKSYFWWVLDGRGNNGWSLLPETEIFGLPHKEVYERIAAYTVAELGEIMKGKGMGVTAYSDLVDTQKGWWVRGGFGVRQQYEHLVHAEEKWADALAKMLIYLIENGLLSPPKK